MGGCNGAGACRLHPLGTTCGAATCSGTTEQGPATCNGLGTCGPSWIRLCGAYACGASSCLTSCTGAAGCASGSNCLGSGCVPAAGAAIVDDFADTDASKNRLNGPVIAESATISQVAGEAKFVWTAGAGGAALSEAFRSNGCEVELGAYKKLRFSLRASAASKRVSVYFTIGNGACVKESNNRLTIITVGTAPAVHEVDLTTALRSRVMNIRWQPQTDDATEYFLDDVTLVP